MLDKHSRFLSPCSCVFTCGDRFDQIWENLAYWINVQLAQFYYFVHPIFPRVDSAPPTRMREWGDVSPHSSEGRLSRGELVNINLCLFWALISHHHGGKPKRVLYTTCMMHDAWCRHWSSFSWASFILHTLHHVQHIHDSCGWGYMYMYFCPYHSVATSLFCSSWTCHFFKTYSRLLGGAWLLAAQDAVRPTLLSMFHLHQSNLSTTT